jgi:hypothetical protein
VSPTHYCTGDVVYLIPLKENLFQLFQYSIDVAVNYAVFAITFIPNTTDFRFVF